MNVVFADAFYFVARLNRRDQHHERVLKLFPPRAKRWTARWNCITGTPTRNGR